MKILYGVVGEGMGHAMRSRVILEYLTSEGYEVEIMASSRACDFLSARFDDVHRIHGFHIITEDNRVRRSQTLWSNLLLGAAALPRQIEAYFEVVRDFEPQVVISDFESWTYLYAKLHGLPVFSIDNMQVIHRCTHLPTLYEGRRLDFEVTRAFVQGKLPRCDHYFITTFFQPPIERRRTSLHPPILRPEILAAREHAKDGDHLLVYHTKEGDTELTDLLAGTGIECRVYGVRRSITEEEVEGNLRFRPFSEQGFVDDLATARGVVASAGFTLMSECVYLHKPMLAVPIARHFEQFLNGQYLEHHGFGTTCPGLTEAELNRFLDAIPACRDSLAGYQQDGNNDLFFALEQEIDRAAAGFYA